MIRVSAKDDAVADTVELALLYVWQKNKTDNRSASDKPLDAVIREQAEARRGISLSDKRGDCHTVIKA
jgi:hypothetical protein